MGIDAGDFDNDGDEDLFVTNWLAQMNILYVNTGGGVFEDRKAASGLGPPSLAKTGFGTAWFDYDNDSLARSAGRQRQRVDHRGAGARQRSVPAEDAESAVSQPAATAGSRTCRRRPAQSFQREDVSRGAAFGDIDNDGDTDVVVGTAAGPTQLLINNVGNRNHWLGLRLVGRPRPRDMLGARVGVVRAERLRRCGGAPGPMAATRRPTIRACWWGWAPRRPPRLRVRVQWPDGTSAEWPSVATDRWTTLTQGQPSSTGTGASR